MPIYIQAAPDKTHLICQYVGNVTDEELIGSWTSFYEGEDWVPGMAELIDVSQADKPTITADGMRQLADYCDRLYRSHGLKTTKVVVYAPNPLPYGLARMYQVYSHQSPEDVVLTKDWDEAKALLAQSL